MKFGPYSFEKRDKEHGSLRQLAVPALVAAALGVGLTFLLKKKLRPSPEVETKSDWVINWVDLTDFKKPEAPKTKEQK